MPSPAAPSGSQTASIPPNVTLRALLDARRNEGRRMSVEEAIAVIVPVCLDLKERHDRGERLYVHPSAIAPGADGLAKLNAKLAVVPTNPNDKPPPSWRGRSSPATPSPACTRSARSSTRW